MLHRIACLALAVAAGSTSTAAAQGTDGFLCCTLHSDGKWISDINYRGAGLAPLPAGTPLKVTGQGRWRVLVEIGGKAQAIGNDYSRTITMDEFTRRYVLADDPRPLIEALPPRLRDAIKAGKVAKGMTREQVVMAVGHPITSYNDKPERPLWRYWADRGSEFQVFWGDDGKVERIFGSPEVRARVAVE
jgi:hypothetical protein